MTTMKCARCKKLYIHKSRLCGECQRAGEKILVSCIPILIEGLKSLPGGQKVLADWDIARREMGDYLDD